MDKSYAMAKFGLESKEMLRSNQKDCWYYVKYFFLFTSIIQFLIILGLVLFMIYGNAHASTETRLKNVESHNLKLLGDIKTQERVVQMLSINLTRAEKEKNLLYVMLEGKKKELVSMNATVMIQAAKIVELTRLTSKLVTNQTPAPKCDSCNEAIQKINNTWFVDKLLCQNEKERILSEYRTYKETCNKTVDNVSSRLRQAESEKDKYLTQTNTLRKEKLDLIAQMDMFQRSCTTIENKFKEELDLLKQNFETALKNTLPDVWNINYQRSKYEAIQQACNPLPSQITSNIDQALTRLRQYVTSTFNENSLLKVNNQRSTEDLRKCSQEKEEILQSKRDELSTMQKNSNMNLMKIQEEKNRMKIEKDEVDRNLKETHNSLTRTSMQLVGLMEELQRCIKKDPLGPGTGVAPNPLNQEVKKTVT